MNYTLAKLYNASGDLSKKWYAYFFFKNAEGKMQMIKKKAGINYFKTVKERKREGEILVTEINNLLIGGWNPFKKLEEQQNNYSTLTLLELMQELYKTKIDTTAYRERTKSHYRHHISILRGYFRPCWCSFLH